MFIQRASRLLVLAILVSESFQATGTAAFPNSCVPQSGGSTPKHGQVRSGLEVLTDTEGIDFNPYLQTLYISVRQDWFAIMPPSVQLGKQGVNKVEFRVMQNGKIPEDSLKMTTHSGKEDLDRASITAIRATKSLSHLPENFSQPFIALRVTFYYNMPRKSSNQGADSTKSTSSQD